MDKKTRIAIRLGSLISSVALCAGIEQFFPSDAGSEPVPRTHIMSKAQTPLPGAKAPEPAAWPEPREAPILVANPLRAPGRFLAAAAAPELKPLMREVAKPVEPAKQAEAPQNPPPMAVDTEEEKLKLWIKPRVGYGVRWFQIEQSGVFGGIKGSAPAMSEISFAAMVRYGAWNLDVGLEKFSVQFAGDTADSTVWSDQAFKHFYIKPGYGIFFFGIDGRVSPIVRASGTTLQWTGLSVLSALAGIRKEWRFGNRGERPFLFGFDVQGSYPLSASGDRGAPSISSPSGVGASFRGSVETPIVRREDYRLNFGLDGTASYDKLNFSGDWGGSSGGSNRSILELGSKVYLGIEF